MIPKFIIRCYTVADCLALDPNEFFMKKIAPYDGIEVEDMANNFNIKFLEWRKGFPGIVKVKIIGKIDDWKLIKDSLLEYDMISAPLGQKSEIWSPDFTYKKPYEYWSTIIKRIVAIGNTSTIISSGVPVGVEVMNITIQKTWKLYQLMAKLGLYIQANCWGNETKWNAFEQNVEPTIPGETEYAMLFLAPPEKRILEPGKGYWQKDPVKFRAMMETAKIIDPYSISLYRWHLGYPHIKTIIEEFYATEPIANEKSS